MLIRLFFACILVLQIWRCLVCFMKLVFIPLMAVMSARLGFMYLTNQNCTGDPWLLVNISRRYFHMIVKFMDAGYIVAADDHVGHGKTAM